MIKQIRSKNLANLSLQIRAHKPLVLSYIKFHRKTQHLPAYLTVSKNPGTSSRILGFHVTSWT